MPVHDSSVINISIVNWLNKCLSYNDHQGSNLNHATGFKKYEILKFHFIFIWSSFSYRQLRTMDLYKYILLLLFKFKFTFAEFHKVNIINFFVLFLLM